jgi:epoxyqueuosine reductase
MDASRCIAYLTIEKKGAIPEDLREPMGRQVFGCDICQDVCPWNRKAPISIRPGLAHRSELVNPELGWLAQMDAKSFKKNFKGSPLERTKQKRIHRNTAIAMGNTADPSFVPQLALWQADDDPVLSEAAQWAMDRIGALSVSSRKDSESSASIGG